MKERVLKLITKERIGLSLSTCTMIIGITFGRETPNGSSLGASLFRYWGIPVWSSTEGHWNYPSLVSLIILIIGLFWARRYMKGKRLFLLLVLVILATPYIQSGITHLYLKNFYGIQTVDYNRQNSMVEVKTDANNSIVLVGHEDLTNYGHEDVTFNMSIRPRSFERQSGSWFTHDIPLENWSNNLDSFTLCPGEERSITVTATINNDPGYSQMQGMANGPDLVISDQQGQKVFVQ